jgi:hypothetical protein
VAIILLSKKNCGIPYSLLPSLFLFVYFIFMVLLLFTTEYKNIFKFEFDLTKILHR